MTQSSLPAPACMDRRHREHIFILLWNVVEVDCFDFLVTEIGIEDAVGLGWPEGNLLADEGSAEPEVAPVPCIILPRGGEAEAA